LARVAQQRGVVLQPGSNKPRFPIASAPTRLSERLTAHAAR